MLILIKVVGMVLFMMGMVNICGEIIFVIDFLVIVGCVFKIGLNILLVIEYVCSIQVFVVEFVDDIVCLEWSQVLVVDVGVKSCNIISIVCFDNDKVSNCLVLVLDVEQILYDIILVNCNV